MQPIPITNLKLGGWTHYGTSDAQQTLVCWIPAVSISLLIGNVVFMHLHKLPEYASATRFFLVARATKISNAQNNHQDEKLAL